MTPAQFIEWKKKVANMYMESPYLTQILNWTPEQYAEYIEDIAAQVKNKWCCSPFSKLRRKRGKFFVFVTLNFDEKTINQDTPLQIVTKITSWNCVQKYAYSFEWRDHEAETGLHAHLILLGDCGNITKNCKRLKGQFTELKKEYGTLLKYPVKFIQDKIDYINGLTFDQTKTDKKLFDDALRIKYNLLSVNNIN